MRFEPAILEYVKNLPKDFKCQNIYIKAIYKAQKNLHQSRSESSKDLHQIQFWNGFYRSKTKNVDVFKSSPKIRIIFHSKNSKLAQMAKNRLIWSHWLRSILTKLKKTHLVQQIWATPSSYVNNNGYLFDLVDLMIPFPIFSSTTIKLKRISFSLCFNGFVFWWIIFHSQLYFFHHCFWSRESNNNKMGSKQRMFFHRNLIWAIFRWIRIYAGSDLPCVPEICTVSFRDLDRR